MNDKEIIIKNFIDNFVHKDKKQRCHFELLDPKKRAKFINNLNHKSFTFLNSKKFKKIEKEFDNLLEIEKNINFKKQEFYYVISNHNKFDDKCIKLQDFFSEIYWFGLATLVINNSGDKVFLKMEQENGKSEKYIGCINYEN